LDIPSKKIQIRQTCWRGFAGRLFGILHCIAYLHKYAANKKTFLWLIRMNRKERKRYLKSFGPGYTEHG
jgi:hypothetical protein